MGMDSFWLQNASDLVDCAMGRIPAELVIRDGAWVCVQTGEIIPHTDIAIRSGRIAYVGEDASHTIDASTQVIDAKGKFVKNFDKFPPHTRGRCGVIIFR